MNAAGLPLYDLTPLVRILLTGVLWASGPVAWVYLRRRHASSISRVRALTLVTLFLCFDLVLFGAFTRLTDSGLGCPDWPGCYGHASPLGAQAPIAAAQADLPSGPVTAGKAWIEMVHRYLATGVGALIVVLAVMSWRRVGAAAQIPTRASWLPTVTLVWVCAQGAFGALTVTMKLFPAIVTLHLLGGLGLLALLAAQVAQHQMQEHPGVAAEISVTDRRWIAAGLVFLLLQAASGAWVSTNYAVLACSEFPMCQGNWWPEMDWSQALEIWRPLGMRTDGTLITFQALTAVHMLHRMLAVLTFSVMVGLVLRMRRHTALEKLVRMFGLLVLLQATTGISNVVLDWPLLAAVVHTGGAGALVIVLVGLWMRTGTSADRSARQGG
jgi:cytochrome c oxidase assembly protein subunit 15